MRTYTGQHIDYVIIEMRDDEHLSEVTRALGKRLTQIAAQHRGSWQSQDISQAGENFATHELEDVTIHMRVPETPWQSTLRISPDLPWADEHFQERVCGEPLNPPPSHVNWPYHAGQQEKHLTAEGKKFDHTYPERFWPKQAGDGLHTRIMKDTGGTHQGIRFKYGDLNDVINLLCKDITTRQAYLPIWFPEDTGASQGQRVPCTLGYHFITTPDSARLDIKYYIRSCDLYRHFTNDVYFTHRLLQHVCEKLSTMTGDTIYPGTMTMHISNLHLFKGNAWRYQ